MAKKKRYQIKENELDLDERPSRSQKKRDSTALQKIGEELVAMSFNKAKKLPLTPELLEALELMTRISDKEGRRRQMQYIGKLMRECDLEELSPALEALRQGHSEDTAKFHHAEKMRESLLSADSAELERLLSPFQADAQEELKVLIARAKAEHSPAAKRELFRKLHEVLG